MLFLLRSRTSWAEHSTCRRHPRFPSSGHDSASLTLGIGNSHPSDSSVRSKSEALPFICSAESTIFAPTEVLASSAKASYGVNVLACMKVLQLFVSLRIAKAWRKRGSRNAELPKAGFEAAFDGRKLTGGRHMTKY